MPETTDRLFASGQKFINDTLTQPDASNISYCEIDTLTMTPGGKEVIASLAPSTEHSSAWLHAPLYGWNGAHADPQFEAINNALVNVSEASPYALVNLAMGIEAGDIPTESLVRDEMLPRIGATLLAGATPSTLMQSVPQVEFMVKSEQDVDTYKLAAQLFFSMLINRRWAAFDLHDVTHHAAQLQRWPDFFAELGALGQQAFTETERGEPDSEEMRLLSSFVLRATFEESLLVNDGEVHSFGCLNWFAPRQTPVALQEASVEPRTQNRWHCLWALSGLQQSQYEAARSLGRDLDWLARLGYTFDDEIKRRIEPDTPIDFTDVPLDGAHEIDIRAPSTANELLHNATELLRDAS